MRLGRARLLAGIAAITTLAGAVAAAAIPSASATTAAPVALTASAATPLPAGAVRLGTVPATTEIHVDVTLNLGNQPGLTALLDGLANPKSPYFRDFIPKGQFGPLFGLSLSAIDQVRAELTALGLDPGQVDSGRTLIPVTATAAALEHAFRTTLVDYRLPGDRVAYANASAPVIPAVIAPYVQGVVGLDDVALAQHASYHAPASTADRTSARAATSGGTAASDSTAGNTARKPFGPYLGVSGSATVPTLPLSPKLSGPAPCEAATDVAVDNDGFTANQIAEHYGLSPLYTDGDLGQGVKVAVAELEPNLSADVAEYEACYGITTPVSYINVDGGAGTGAGSGEAALDIENIAGLAPDVTIDDYEAPTAAATSLLDIVTEVADRDVEQVLSVSWGLCEADANSALLTAFYTEYQKLNAEGITAVGASGDYGPAGCYTTAAPSATLSVESPASTPFGLSIGGTTMTSEFLDSTETTWNGSGTTMVGAGGGGLSEFCMLPYQDPTPAIEGLINPYSEKGGGCSAPGYARETPDVSGNASGASPYPIYYDGAWDIFWGTSASTTLVAAEAALIDASPFCGSKGWSTGPAGILPQALYAVVSTDSNFIYLGDNGILNDVTSGNTDYTPTGSPAGLYPATKGYDLATGLGAPLLTGLSGYPNGVPGMAAAMCNALASAKASNITTTSIYPAYAKAGKTTTFTVHGTGMVVLPDSDEALLYTKQLKKQIGFVFAQCSSHTTCRVTLPGLPAGTYQLELNAVDFAPCVGKGCKASVTFIVSGPPKISKISPTGGAQGTKVTIHGSNFFGVAAVYFGGRKGTSLKVISSTEITVVAPKGYGTQKVKVIAAGGTSNEVNFTY